MGYRKFSGFLLHIKNKNKTASSVFSEIYAKNLWGGDLGEYYSGPGSEGIYAERYIKKINGFIKSLKKENIHVVDLGCGDFRIGKVIAKENNINYAGVDVVPDLVEKNKKEYGSGKIKFLCLDIASDDLPDGDICLIRQVLQHLSNDQIKKILEKIKKYKYIFVTESHPSQIVKYNEDKPHGQDVRIYCGSGVFLDKDPFNVKNMELVMNIPCGREEEINTYLIKNI